MLTWLGKAELADLKDAFVAFHIQGRQLLDIDQAAIERMVVPEVRRQLLLDAVAELRRNVDVTEKGRLWSLGDDHVDQTAAQPAMVTQKDVERPIVEVLSEHVLDLPELVGVLATMGVRTAVDLGMMSVCDCMCDDNGHVDAGGQVQSLA